MSVFKLSLKARLSEAGLSMRVLTRTEIPGGLAAHAPGAIILGAAWACLALGATGFLVLRQGSGDLPAAHAPGMLVPLASAVVSYLLRLARWFLLLRRAIGSVNVVPCLRAQVIGFALAATPGRAGEPLKFYLLDHSSGVSAGRGGAVLLVERLSDALGLALIAIFGLLLVVPEMFTGDLLMRYLAVPLALVALVVVAATCSGGLINACRGRTSRWRTILADFLNANHVLLRGSTPPAAVALTVVARLCDALTVYLIALTLGWSISYPQAALVLGLAGLAGGLSPLPGGAGAVEAVMAGLLVGLGGSNSTAMGITIVARAFTYWLWVAIGLAVLAATWRGFSRRRRDAHLSELHPS